MRVSKDQAELLRKSIVQYCPDAKVYLFGSRVDDSGLGGDIDILIIDDKKLTISEKAKIERLFWERYGEQKLDLVCYTNDSNHPFKKLALLEAIEL